MKAMVFAVLMPWALGVHAQSSTTPLPPPLPAAGKAEKPTASMARRKIELSPADRDTIDARELKAVKPASVEEALQPTPEDAKIERDENFNKTRIEQTRTSNRISEVIVTPGGTSRSYSMTNREGKEPFGTTQMSPGLSVPNFFRFEFGRTAPATPIVPAPPAASPSAPAKPSN